MGKDLMELWNRTDAGRESLASDLQNIFLGARSYAIA
jgi:hypothetical protein